MAGTRITEGTVGEAAAGTGTSKAAAGTLVSTPLVIFPCFLTLVNVKSYNMYSAMFISYFIFYLLIECVFVF